MTPTDDVLDGRVLDELFVPAVAALDAGDVPAIERLVGDHPRLVHDRLDVPGVWLRDKVGSALDGFFERPYLLWFVAEDPVRNGRLPANIADVTHAIVRAARHEGVTTLAEQLDYALYLVASSWVARDCGVQLGLLDALIDAGASTDRGPDAALVNNNVAAAAHLANRGATLTLGAALCLERWDEVARLGPPATGREKQYALTLSALRGRAEALTTLLALGVDLAATSPELYSHATALHHAVSSGSLDKVKVLVEAGAPLDVTDSVYGGTPLGWAEYGRHAAIAGYLRSKSGWRRLIGM